ncbi:MAG: CsiV family protein [Candidatus Thiodiazotropha sp. 6PLUC2]
MIREMFDKKEKNLLLILGFLLILPMSLQAESNSGETSEPWYQFEILVFRRIAPGAGGTEAWEFDPGIPDQEGSVRLNRGPLTQGNKPIAYRALPAVEKSLTEAWSIMRRSRDYRPLYHIAWRQPVTHPDRATPLYFSLKPKSNSAFDEPLPRLEGRIKFGVKRYLHLETDILLRAENSNSLSEEGYGPSFRSYRMQDKRRMRSGKLHYLDHPVLGVLAIAKRYEMPVPEVIEPPAAKAVPIEAEETQQSEQ